MTKEEQIQKLAEELQLDCHKTVETVMNSSGAYYQDATNVWLFMRLAEQELRIIDLEKQINSK